MGQRRRSRRLWTGAGYSLASHIHSERREREGEGGREGKRERARARERERVREGREQVAPAVRSEAFRRLGPRLARSVWMKGIHGRHVAVDP